MEGETGRKRDICNTTTEISLNRKKCNRPASVSKQMRYTQMPSAASLVGKRIARKRRVIFGEVTSRQVRTACEFLLFI